MVISAKCPALKAQLCRNIDTDTVTDPLPITQHTFVLTYADDTSGLSVSECPIRATNTRNSFKNTVIID